MNTNVEPGEHTPVQARCPVCRLELPPGLPANRCPRCLLRVGLGADPADTTAATVVATAAPTRTFAPPLPGATFGHYRIVRVLGEGGMGTVFEAEDLDCGRRLALKVLSQQLDSPEARRRFFREGRLAASINHPNSVYVYGTEEIAGVPVIAMELVARGTLHDRVARQGPMPVAEAVDAILQVIAGLEAAQRVGVLHRDVKPANCFVGADGSVKIGDFGLSISTALRIEPSLTAVGGFLGTPAFSSPEQLRGDALTVRSDIYALGVTLYYLLTGRQPFEAANLMQMLATVLENRPQSPAAWRSGLPDALCRVTLRCLEKNPDARSQDYEQLRAVLLPYTSTAPKPATLVWRCLAGCIDRVVLGPTTALMSFLLLGSAQAKEDLTKIHQPGFLLVWVSYLLLLLANYVLLEGRYGASVGKWIAGLRVVRPDRTPPGVPRAAMRALIMFGLKALPAGSLYWLAPGWLAGPRIAAGSALLAGSFWVLLLLLFSTARRRNGFAAWHDLATNTRVVVKAAFPARPPFAGSDQPLPNLTTAPQIGFYHVLADLGGNNDAQIHLGFDARLLRRVWIRTLPPGAPPLAASLRYLARPGRLRWLGGQRTATQAWDAFEAASGGSLLSLLSHPQSWNHVRFWLLDLAEELLAAGQDGTLPAILALDRVWITREGRAKLLDFPAPDTADFPATASDPAPSSADFLRQVAFTALEGRLVGADDSSHRALSAPLPLSARACVGSLRAGVDPGDLVAKIRALLDGIATVSCRRRLAMLGGSLLIPFLSVSFAVVMLILRTWLLQGTPELAALHDCLRLYDDLHRRTLFGDTSHAREADALATYIAYRFEPTITNSLLWNGFAARTAIDDYLRAEASDIARRVHPSEDAVAKARAILLSSFGHLPDQGERPLERVRAEVLATAVPVYMQTLIFVILPCLFLSLLFRGGGLAFALRIAWVNSDGAPSSRARVVCRNFVTWLPFLALPLGVRVLSPQVGQGGAIVLAGGACAALALVSSLLPQRGLADRLVGTWPVPR